MQIVIDIPESAYETCKSIKNVESEQGNFVDLMLDVTANGTVLTECDDVISRQAVLDIIRFEDKWLLDAKGHNANTEIAFSGMKSRIAELPSVRPQEKTGHCKDCKWWKDSDGAFRRGIGAESQCPMNRIEVFEGNGYCYMFKPQEESEKK